jgi:hypothetical protein
MRKRFHVVLPTVVGSISTALMLWDAHNERVIESMGMAWDTGAPIWPYQISSLLLMALNAPANILATPLYFLLRLSTMESRYPVLLAAILVWWWWIGRRIDFGILERRYYHRPRLLAFLCGTFAALLIGLSVYGVIDEFHWWRTYGSKLPSVSLLLLIRTIGPVLWALLLASGLLLAAAQLIQQRSK